MALVRVDDACCLSASGWRLCLYSVSVLGLANGVLFRHSRKDHITLVHSVYDNCHKSVDCCLEACPGRKSGFGDLSQKKS